MPLTLTRERVEETVAQYVYPRAITFDEWLEIGERDAPTDLVNGTPSGAADGTTGTRKA